jgi:hypothetical protein
MGVALSSATSEKRTRFGQGQLLIAKQRTTKVKGVEVTASGSRGGGSVEATWRAILRELIGLSSGHIKDAVRELVRPGAASGYVGGGASGASSSGDVASRSAKR